jgi:uncharacterized protein (DUF58 family)
VTQPPDTGASAAPDVTGPQGTDVPVASGVGRSQGAGAPVASGVGRSQGAAGPVASGVGGSQGAGVPVASGVGVPRPGRAGTRSGVTGRGIGLIIAAVALLVAGFRYGYPDLALLGGAAMIALVAAVVFAFWRPTLGVTRIADPDRVARGEPANVTLTISNTSRVRSATLIATDRCGSATVQVPLLRLRAGHDTVESYPVPTHRRGLVPVGPLHVTRRDPLGLLTLARAYGDSIVVRVYPKVHPLRAVPAGLTRSLDGNADKVPHGTITFDTLREYVPGDELRRVHWRSSAKVGELMVREQLDTAEPTIVVLLDDRASAHRGDSFEDACEAAASIAVAAVREDLPVSLHLVTASTSGPHLDVLTEATLGDGDLAATLRQLRAQKLGDTLIFLTGPGGRDDLGAVSGLRAAYPIALAVILGDRDSSPAVPTDRLLVIEAVDGAEFAAAWDGVRGW